MRRHSTARLPVSASAFAGFRFAPEVIVLAVRWYLRFSLSYRDLEELQGERGIFVDHVTLCRWVARFTPLPSSKQAPTPLSMSAEPGASASTHLRTTSSKSTRPACCSTRPGPPGQPRPLPRPVLEPRRATPVRPAAGRGTAAIQTQQTRPNADAWSSRSISRPQRQQVVFG